MKPTTKPSPSESPPEGDSLSTSFDDSTHRSVANAWTQRSLLDIIRDSTASAAPIAAVSKLPFIKPQPCAQKTIMEHIHRIDTPVIYGAINDTCIDVFLDDSGSIIPPPDAEHPVGVSYFIPSVEFMEIAHTSFSKYKECGCFLSGGMLPEGIDYKQDRQLKRNDKRRKPHNMGLHFSVFPTRSMSKKDFESKILELRVDAKCIIARGEHCDSPKAPPTPDYPVDALLRQVSAALFELATSDDCDPNRAFRALYFHYLLAENDAKYEWILRGDALSYYSAQALEVCKTSSNTNIEELRDEIRGDLAEIILHNPKYRSYPDDYSEVENTSVVTFGECMVNPQEDDDDYGDLEDTTSDAGEVLLPGTTPAPQSHRAEGETLNVSAGEVCMVFCEILKYNAVEYFLSVVNKLVPNSGFDKVPALTVRGSPQKIWSPAEVTMHNFFHTLQPDTILTIEVHSLTVKIDNVPRERGAAFVKVLETNPDLSNLFLAVVACLKGRSFASTHFLGARQTDSYKIVEHEGHGKSVSVRIFDVVPILSSAYICTAVNKCIKCFKRDVWGLRRRVIVMCLSTSHCVDLNKVHPGTTPAAARKRTQLRDKLQSCLGVPLSSTDEFVFGSYPLVHKFLVFSYGEELHKLTSAVAVDCFRQLQVTVRSTMDVFVQF